jgi:hypothetical protein
VNTSLFECALKTHQTKKKTSAKQIQQLVVYSLFYTRCSFVRSFVILSTTLKSVYFFYFFHSQKNVTCIFSFHYVVFQPAPSPLLARVVLARRQHPAPPVRLPAGRQPSPSGLLPPQPEPLLHPSQDVVGQNQAAPKGAFQTGKGFY